MPKFIADFFPNVANYWDIFLTALNGTYHIIDRRLFWHFVDCNKDRWYQTESNDSLYFRSYHKRV